MKPLTVTIGVSLAAAFPAGAQQDHAMSERLAYGDSGRLKTVATASKTPARLDIQITGMGRIAAMPFTFDRLRADAGGTGRLTVGLAPPERLHADSPRSGRLATPVAAPDRLNADAPGMGRLQAPSSGGTAPESVPGGSVPGGVNSTTPSATDSQANEIGPIAQAYVPYHDGRGLVASRPPIRDRDPFARPVYDRRDPGAPFADDVSFGLGPLSLVRGFTPETFDLKLGRVYVDFRSLSATLLYSDYHGSGKFREGQEPGWLGAVSLNLEVVVPISKTICFAAAASVYYLPLTNKFGVSTADGGSLIAHLSYRRTLGEWEWGAYDALGLIDPLADLYGPLDVSEIEVAGRYRFGVASTVDQRGQNPYDSSRLLLTNLAGLKTAGPIAPAWELDSALFRRDFWSLNGDSGHFSRTSFNNVARYVGHDWRFAPFVGAEVSTGDDYKNLRHEVYTGVSGPITDRLNLYTRAGYAFATGPRAGADSFIYELGLSHQTGPLTRQSLFGGTAVEDLVTGRQILGTYVRYSITQQLAANLSGSLFTQASKLEDLQDNSRTQVLMAGMRMIARLGESTQLSINPFYDRSKADNRDPKNRLVVTSTLLRRLSPDLSGSLVFRVENLDSDEGNGFTEFLYMITLTKRF